MRGLSQLGINYDAPGATYENDLPAGSNDVSGYADLQFRAGVNFADLRNNFTSQDFDVVLADNEGHTASTSVGQWSPALFFPPGKYVDGPKLILDAVRIPLSAFPGVRLDDLHSVQFVFDRRASGSLFFADLAFVDPVQAPVS